MSSGSVDVVLSNANDLSRKSSREKDAVGGGLSENSHAWSARDRDAGGSFPVNQLEDDPVDSAGAPCPPIASINDCGVSAGSHPTPITEDKAVSSKDWRENFLPRHVLELQESDEPVNLDSSLMKARADKFLRQQPVQLQVKVVNKAVESKPQESGIKVDMQQLQVQHDNMVHAALHLQQSLIASEDTVAKETDFRFEKHLLEQDLSRIVATHNLPATAIMPAPPTWITPQINHTGTILSKPIDAAAQSSTATAAPERQNVSLGLGTSPHNIGPGALDFSKVRDIQDRISRVTSAMGELKWRRQASRNGLSRL